MIIAVRRLVMCKIVDVKVGNRQVKVADIKTKYLANIAASAKECPLYR